MKIRTGFVSNSSSSSFLVIPNERIPTIFALAKRMLEIRDSDWETDSREPGGELFKLATAENLFKNPNTPVVFSTTNYETYIVRSEFGELLVATCNNQDWSQLETDVSVLFNDDLEISKTSTYFWYIKEGVMGKPVTDKEWKKFVKENPQYKIRDLSYAYCWLKEQHYADIVKTTDNKIVCVECYKIAGNKDMVLSPALRVKNSPQYIIKKPLRFRG